MRNKKLLVVAGTILLASVLLGSAVWAEGGTQGLYNYSGSTSGNVLEVTNTGSGTAIRGNANNFASNIAVYGQVKGNTAYGVRGYSELGGTGVYGRNTTSGVGVYGINDSGGTGYGGYFTGNIGVYGKSTSHNASMFSTTAYNYDGVTADCYGAGACYGVHAYGTENGIVASATNGSGAYVSGPYGVYASTTATDSAAIYGYSSYSNSPAVKAVASASNAVYGETTWYGNFAGVFVGHNTDMSGGVWAISEAPDNLDLRTDDCAMIAGVIYGCTKEGGGVSVIASNVGTQALQPGDVVVFKGSELNALGTQIVSVDKAGPKGGVVVGVVRGLFDVGEVVVVPAAPAREVPQQTAESVQQPVQAPVPEGEAPLPADAALPSAATASEQVLSYPASAPTFAGGVASFIGGSVEAGKTALVSFQGYVPVTITAAKAIAAGDWIAVKTDGTVISIGARGYSNALDRGYTILGRALEGMAAGTGQVLVQLDLR